MDYSAMGGAAAGGLVGGAFGLISDKLAFDRSKWMASNAHQLEVQDLKAAGLNPILSGMGGSGASFPSVANTAGATASSAAGVGSRAAQESRVTEATIDNLHASAEASRASAAASLANKDYTRRRSDVELGKPGAAGIVDPKSGKYLPGGAPERGLRQLEVEANVALMKQRAAELGFSNVRKAAEAGVYKDFPMLVPLEMGVKMAEQTGSAVKAVLPRPQIKIQPKKGGK